MSDTADRCVVQCNHAEGTSAIPPGARCYVLQHPGDPDRVLILARSRSGRWIHVWEHIRQLRDCRVKTLPPTHPRYQDAWMSLDPDETLARITSQSSDPEAGDE